MDVPQHSLKVLMYMTRRIDWAYQRVYRSCSAKVGNRSDLEEMEEEKHEEEEEEKEEEEEHWIESQW